MYFRNEKSGFFEGPFASEKEDIIRFGSGAYQVIVPTADELSVLMKLKQTPFDIQPTNTTIDGFVEMLNTALSDETADKHRVKIKVEVPPSWDLPLFSSEQTKLWGYADGFGGSRRNTLPGVFIRYRKTSSSSPSIYEMLHILRMTWLVPFKFTIEGETVVLKVADYDTIKMDW
jgi:hypothetical protein